MHLNNFQTYLLILIILTNIEVSSAKTCRKETDIRWISKNTNKTVGCTPCQSCGISEEYSIPCGTKAYIGTKSECVPSPNGKYSDGFNTKPCISCTICSNRVIIKNCTSYSNSVCGDCLPGYYSEDVVFGCIKCAQCCHDGQDKTHASCSAVKQCKPRPNGCPVIPTTKASTVHVTATSKNNTTTPGINNQTVKTISSSSTGATDSGGIDVLATNGSHNKSEQITTASSSHQSTQNEFFNVNNVWFVVSITCLTVACAVLIIIVIRTFKKRNKLKKSNPHRHNDMPNLADDASGGVNPEQHELLQNIEMRDLEDQILENFYNKRYDVIDKLCSILMKKKRGMYDFERLASELNVEKDEVTPILNEIQVQNGSPVRKLLDVLIAQRLCTTVRRLAEAVKDINKDAYEALKPHFFKPLEP